MQRITVSLDDDIMDLIDTYQVEHGVANRSEAVRDLVRTAIAVEHRKSAALDTFCVASLTYAYDPHSRDLATRVHAMHQGRHDLTVAALHVHLDHHTCLEVVALKGPVQQVRALADAVTRERGVRHGHLHVVPALSDAAPHSHDNGPTHGHVSV